MIVTMYNTQITRITSTFVSIILANIILKDPSEATC